MFVIVVENNPRNQELSYQHCTDKPKGVDWRSWSRVLTDADPSPLDCKGNIQSAYS